MELFTRFKFIPWIVKSNCLICLFLCTTGSVSAPSELSGAAQLTESQNLYRVEAMTKACDSLGDPPPLQSEQLQHLLVDESHRLLYCYVPKVACTNWKRIMMILSGKWNNTDVLGIPATLAHSPGVFPNLENFTEPERENILENYTKIIFVRHPFERVLSAFRNKLEDNSPSATYFQKRVGRTIVQLLRPNASNSSLDKGDDVTFEEFVEYLTLPLSTTTDIPYTVNEHWESIVQLCHPCYVKYSIIGKYETLLDDSILALNMIDASHISFPRDIRTSGTAEKLRKYYGALPLVLIRKLYEVYRADFKLFDYNLEEILGFDLG